MYIHMYMPSYTRTLSSVLSAYAVGGIDHVNVYADIHIMYVHMHAYNMYILARTNVLF